MMCNMISEPTMRRCECCVAEARGLGLMNIVQGKKKTSSIPDCKQMLLFALRFRRRQAKASLIENLSNWSHSPQQRLNISH